MTLTFSARPLWALIFCVSTLATAYRPTQFCKHRGENGQADMCFGVNTYYNTTTERSDIYMTLHTWRFASSAKGWACMGIGQQMTGSLMFIVYGDPESDGGHMETVVRTAVGHHPPLNIEDSSVYSGPRPEIEVRRSEFVPYEGKYFNEKLQLVPTHVGISEVICYGCDVWEGFPIDNTTNSQKMIWSTNSWQDFQGDFGVNRAIEMHKFGMGFGFLWVDYLHAQVQEPFFPVIRELDGHYGMNEVTTPDAPTDAELEAGAKIIAFGGKIEEEPTHEPTDDSHDATPNDDDSLDDDSHDDDSHDDDSHDDLLEDLHDDIPTTSTPTQEGQPEPTDGVAYPAKTWRGKTLRDWMWHLHGLLMVLAFLFLFPLGAYFVRSGRATAFNLHWTTQAFASMMVLVGAIIGYWQSNGISVPHQYMGFAICAALVAQIVIGGLHHRRYLVIKRKTALSTAHVWGGRVILGAGMVNLVLGIQLRKYGRAVYILLVAAIIIVLMSFTFAVGREGVRALTLPLDQRVERRGEEAEEYFQLVGDEDESESEDEEEGKARAEAKREQARRLAKLDKV